MQSPLEFNPTDQPHRRYNPLTDRWVLVSPQRTRRPWLGQIEKAPPDDRPAYDPGCYLCPGNRRASGEINPQYEATFTFTNDFSALLPDIPPAGPTIHPLLQTQSVQGTCRVMCFSPRHDLTLPQMSREEIRKVIDEWARQASELSDRYRWVQIFENKGSLMGASNPHPHGQIWASDSLPNEAALEDRQQRRYLEELRRPLLVDYADLEGEQQVRLVVANHDWMAVVPYWAVWPFETLLMPHRHVLNLPDLRESERENLGDILQRLLIKYDNLFETSFPYSMGWHGAPSTSNQDIDAPGGTQTENAAHWQLHAHFYPPLLRSATVKKFMVGYEMLAEAQRDLTPEGAADRLRSLPDIHYLGHRTA
jgi:UDPglucose--hexose-1-phosphate uridylyltransferase